MCEILAVKTPLFLVLVKAEGFRCKSDALFFCYTEINDDDNQ